jgi:exopolyphosphatase/guanosine-5'-triphosphate,3'-diphosphate pyrophosphatase
MRRYHVDPAQAGRVGLLGADLFRQLADSTLGGPDKALQCLTWAARLHEVGLSIAHGGYHKHSAYIIENADMPGFSKKEQARLGLLILAQRGSLGKVAAAVAEEMWGMVLALRLAVLFYRSRADLDLPEMALGHRSGGFRLALDKGWLTRNPLTEAALEAEVKEWKGVGVKLVLSGR